MIDLSKVNFGVFIGILMSMYFLFMPNKYFNIRRFMMKFDNTSIFDMDEEEVEFVRGGLLPLFLGAVGIGIALYAASHAPVCKP